MKLMLLLLGVCTAVVAQPENNNGLQGHPTPPSTPKLTQWNDQLRFFNSTSKIQYEYKNDETNLFLIFKTSDESTKRQLLSEGFKIQIKVKSDPRVIASIAFAGLSAGNRKTTRPPMQMNGQHPSTNENGSPADLELPIQEVPDTAIVAGFLYAKNFIVENSDDTRSMTFVRSRRNREGCSYEFRIPLNELFGGQFSLEKIISVDIQATIDVNGKSDKGRNKSGNMGMEGSGGGPGGGMGGPGGGMGGPGGGMGGPGGGMEQGSDMGDRSDMEADTQKTTMIRKSFKFDIVLSESGSQAR